MLEIVLVMLAIALAFATMLTFAVQVDRWRGYEDGTESGSSPIAAENTNFTRIVNADSSWHLRLLVQETAGSDGATTDDYQLQYQKNGGSWTNVTASSANVKGFNSSSLTDGGATTNRSTNGITDGSGTFVAGKISEDGLLDDWQLTSMNFSELLYSLTFVAADLARGDTIAFRLLRNGSVLTMNVTPTITIGKNVTLTAANGSYTLSGQAAQLYYNRVVTAANGSYSLSGQTANFIRGYAVLAGSGTFSLSGQAANLLYARILSANNGAYTLAGQNANLVKGITMPASHGVFTLSGQAAQLYFNRVVTASFGSYTIAGQNANLVYTPLPAAWRQNVFAISGRRRKPFSRARTYVIEPPRDPITEGTPFLPELGNSATLGDQALARLAGVRVRVIVAFRTSVPLWELKRDYRKVASAIGVDAAKLRGRIALAERKIIGRSGSVPSSTADMFKNLTKRQS